MIRKVRRIDLGKLFTSGRSGMLSEKAFILFKRKIIESIQQKGPNELLLFDLFEVNAVPKFTISEEIFDIITQHNVQDGNVFFFNVSEEFYSSLCQPLLSLSVNSGSAIIPFILTSGRWKWLGLTSEPTETALNLLVRNRFISSEYIAELAQLSPSQIEYLRAVVDANPALFTYDYIKDQFKCKFSINTLLGLIVKNERDIISKEFYDSDLLFKGHFALPSGHHINTCVLTSQIPRHPNLSDRIFAQVARTVWATSPDIVITSSLFSFMLGERLRKQLKQRVVNTFGYPIPRPRYGDTIESDKRVFILTDIYSTGSSFNHIRRQILTDNAFIVGAMSIVDAHGNGVKDDIQASIELSLQLFTEKDCPQCRKGIELDFLDPFSCLPYKMPHRIKPPKGILGPDKFWNLLREQDAIQYSVDSKHSKSRKNAHPIYNGNHFTVFINTRKILRNTAISRELASAALSTVGPSFDAILIPKNEGALLLAQAIQQYILHHFGLAPEIITCSKDHERNVFVVPNFIRKSLKNSSLLIVDDGANTGSTLIGLHYAISAYKPRQIKYLVFIDRLFGSNRQNIQALLGANYHFLFHLAVPVYREWDCPVCFERESQHFNSSTRKAPWQQHAADTEQPDGRKATKLTWEAENK